MIAVIEEHNQLTGYRLVVGLYGGIAAAITALCGYYVLNGRLIEATVWFGFEVNCLVIAAFAAAALRAGRPDVGIGALRDPVRRRAIDAAHPRLSRHTTILIIVTFVPYTVAVLGAADALRRSPGRS